ncbi:hypothetical protein SKAU_G00105190 [Synaphobranchus kaupii]|uniref:Tetraspanin n=1 Tax=Synaphobranchus kaupii TaxID=118154 RepID=A0A9Q1G0B6_SYNKA|nr:hypothetical protein SKAU_G00105190 [Synaphobranchus kaupii]
MAINSCFKGVFIFFNILLGVAGVLLLGIGILGHSIYHAPGEFDDKMSAIFFLYVTGGATLALSICGMYGAHKEKKWALIVFFTGMLLGSLGLLLMAITTSIGAPMVIQTVNNLFHESIPLDEAGTNVQKMFNVLQPELKCCGVFNGYRDWGSHVPDSCLCPSITDKCEKMTGSQRVLDTLLDTLSGGSEKLVYKEPCAPYVLNYLEKVLNSILGVCIGCAIMAFIGMVMSMTMVCKIRRESSPVTFSINPSPPRYTELHNTMEA